MENRPIIGNVLIATRSIKATETVLEELPAALGHHAKTKPCCIECGAQMDKSQDGVEQRCENCNFPLCNKTDQCKFLTSALLTFAQWLKNPPKCLSILYFKKYTTSVASLALGATLELESQLDGHLKGT